MRALLTGASSFTGAWIAKALEARGVHVIAPCGQALATYEGLKRERLNWISGTADLHFNIRFGDERFVDLILTTAPDILCLHGAELTNYRSWDFDPLFATAENTRNIRQIFETFAQTGRLVIATGTVFEPFEGVGDPQKRAFNPYGLSKHLSFETFRMEAERINLPLAKFVIPNPFGPLEEPRFTSYLVRENLGGRVPKVSTPDYVRDNIHVGLLSAAYARFVDDALAGATHLGPSGYVETQGAFAHRFIREVGARLGQSWSVDLAEQTDFSEPTIRTNDRPATDYVDDWSEADAWNALAAYYSETVRS